MNNLLIIYEPAERVKSCFITSGDIVDGRAAETSIKKGESIRLPFSCASFERILKKPDRVAKTHAASDLWGNVFNKRNVVVKQSVAQIVCIHRKDACVML